MATFPPGSLASISGSQDAVAAAARPRPPRATTCPGHGARASRLPPRNILLKRDGHLTPQQNAASILCVKRHCRRNWRRHFHPQVLCFTTDEPHAQDILPCQQQESVSCKGSTYGPSEGGKVGLLLHSGNYAVASFRSPSAEARPGNTVADSQRPPQTAGETLCTLMPAIVLAAAVTALVHPPTFTWFQKQHYPYALGGIMFSIGVQLSLQDFTTVLKQPVAVALGFLLQYALKPAVALLTLELFRVPPQFAAGLLLTASVSGAQLASYASSLAKGSVALSVVLTSLTTIASVVITPLLSKLLIGAVIPIDGVAMGWSILQVVVLPITLGLLLNIKARPLVDAARPWLPFLATTCTVLCIGSPLASNRSMLVTWQGLSLVAPIVFFHVACAAVGYWITQIPTLKQDNKVAQTLAINGAMQSSTLAVLLATQFLKGSHPVAPSCSVVVMAVLGLSLGSFWGKGEQFSSKAADILEFFANMRNVKVKLENQREIRSYPAH